MEPTLLLGPVASLAGPWALWFIEQLIPASHRLTFTGAIAAVVIEELYKGVIVWWGAKNSRTRLSHGWLALVGFSFGVSETILHLFNALQFDQGGMIWWRLLVTTPMHVVTVFLIYEGYRRFRQPLGRWLGLAAAIFLHAFYNWCVRGWIL